MLIITENDVNPPINNDTMEKRITPRSKEQELSKAKTICIKHMSTNKEKVIKTTFNAVSCRPALQKLLYY